MCAKSVSRHGMGTEGEVEKGSGLGMCPHQRLSDPAVILHGTGPA